ncbi:DUF1385 domain-containing protein [Eubacterium xylanophilum]|uniref:DUF1385 domain-containing protein n=1 Tax=Eubacterium xylanophilum TaxID=39497 RepID=UPI0004B5F3ED
MRFSGIGGQAVIEGVMMRNKSRYAVAVRKSDGTIETNTYSCGEQNDNSKVAKIPLVRGVAAFIESLKIGMKSLDVAASFLEEEEEKIEKDGEKKGSGIAEGLIMIVAIIFALGIFVLFPFWVSEKLTKYIASVQLRGLIEGVLRVALFVIYVKLISLMNDIKRVFMYHGAEHKCINCIENGLPLNVENARKQTTFHKRCGTTFLLWIMLISILFFMFISFDNVFMRMGLRIVLVPVIAGISYEFLRLAGRNESKILDILSKPGFWMQSLTTKEPDDEMLEVAIASVNAVFDWRAFLAEDGIIVEDEREDDDEVVIVDITEESAEESVIEMVEVDDDSDDDDELAEYFESGDEE